MILALGTMGGGHGEAAERLRADIQGCGVYQTSGYTDEQGTLNNPHLDGHKLMVWWSQVEPEEGKYKWSVIEGPMRRWLAAGKRFMLSPVTVHSDRVPGFPAQATPDWVFDAGARSVPLPLKGGKDSIRIPVYWDPVYLGKYRSFIRALGQRFDGQKGLELVCCGTGTYGETIVSPELWGQKEHQPWADAGLTSENWIKAVNTVVDAYVEAFPTTLVGLQVTNPGLVPHRESCTPAYARHAAEKGVLLQYCGVTPEPFQWNGQFYVDAIKRWAGVTSLGFEAYSPSSGAAPPNSTFVFKGGLKDIVDVTLKHQINYLVMWHQDALKATPGHKTHHPEWEAAIKRAATSLRHGPSGGSR
ncbi:MAG: hypothetical protein WCS99_04355 [Limisphaerales bacterium]